MNIISICAATVVSSVLAVFMRKYNAEYSLIIAVCTSVLVLIYILSSVVLAISSVKDIFAQADFNPIYIKILLKCVGICFLTEFTCDCCKDSSQSALSSVVLMSGRICVLLTAMPLFEEFLSLALDLSSGGTG